MRMLLRLRLPAAVAVAAFSGRAADGAADSADPVGRNARNKWLEKSASRGTETASTLLTTRSLVRTSTGQQTPIRARGSRVRFTSVELASNRAVEGQHARVRPHHALRDAPTADPQALEGGDPGEGDVALPKVEGVGEHQLGARERHAW